MRKSDLKVLVVGGGGREHALVQKIAASPRVERVFCAPGNAGIAEVAEIVDISAGDVGALLAFARETKIDLTVVGPEAPLCAGIVDDFVAAGLAIFGPTRDAAELEGSKAFAKGVMQHHMIPTAGFRVFDEADDARSYLRSVLDWPVVIKADGLAAGKGVVVARDLEEADDVVEQILTEGRFGAAGGRIVVEEFLRGEEASVLAFTDGTTITVLDASQDHKAAYDGDRGPNTGGMGAYCPAPVVTAKVFGQVVRDVLVPLVHAMRKERRPYRGLLYAGLMITKSGPKVLEFNVRFGDPEAQVVLPRLKTDVVDLFEATIEGTLADVTLEWDERPAVCVVLASGGYPGSIRKGLPIDGLDRVRELPDVFVYHAGTALQDGKVVTSGGRVLGVTALGPTLSDARRRAYEAVGEIRFEGMHYRTDIAARAIGRSDGPQASAEQEADS